MDRLRRHSRQHRAAVALLLVLALALRFIVPAGYMPVFSNGSMSFAMCDGMGPMAMAALPGMAHHKGDHPGQDKAEQPCGGAGLTAPALGGADPVLLVAAIIAIIAAGLAPRIPRPIRAIDRLRPPLRAPPIRA